MRRVAILLRMSLSFAVIAVGIVLTAFSLGLVPDRDGALRQGRKALCEELALHASSYVQVGRPESFFPTLEGIVQRHPDILGAAVRRTDGTVLMQTGEPAASTEGAAAGTHARVPIALNDRPWGTVEVHFRPLRPTGLTGALANPLVRLPGFVGLAALACYALYLRRFLGTLARGRAGLMPRRVRATLDTLAEGLVILDQDDTIVVANEAFGQLVGKSVEALEGLKVNELPWAAVGQEEFDKDHSWLQSARAGVVCQGALLSLRGNGVERVLSVNASPILGDDARPRGVLATFADQTAAQQKNAHLRTLLQCLRQSQAEARQQNAELKAQATRDPLTACLNRRAFYQEAEVHWNAARRYRTPLTCILVDLDHFRAINDRHGLVSGDQVLQRVAHLLQAAARKSDLVCRYGGEEFCLLLTHTDLAGALVLAERLRTAIAARPCAGVPVTASVGVANAAAAGDVRELLEQANRCLSTAKRQGRDRVVAWSDLTEQEMGREAGPSPAEGSSAAPAMPFPAVTALVAALGYRHADTAEHSWRVADLCVSAAEGLLSPRDSYVLEVAALLHDIGKLSVPDAILLKPGPLTTEEWKAMRAHERIGEEIIRSAFSCAELTEIVSKYHCRYGGNSDEPGQPAGEAIPLGARLLSIADAFDSITSDRVYRQGRSRDEAFDELRRCAAKQFDPALVERFIAAVLARDDNRSAPAVPVRKQVSLRLGLQVERLTHALGAGDTRTVAAVAAHLGADAAASGIAPIADVASRLQQCAASAGNPAELTQLTIDLLDACRSTYPSATTPAGENVTP